MKFCSKSNVGLVRKHNEDSFCINEDINLLAVADGMGGHNAGEVASAMALEVLETNLLRQNNWWQVDPKAALEQVIKEANKKIYETARGNDDQKGMGTTITAAIINDNQIILGHVGDSRAYLIHNSTIRQITQDHSLVNEMVKNGGLTEEEASHHPQKNILTRALGTSPDVVVDIYQEKVTKGDTLILCSDGLSNLITRDEMNQIVSAGGVLECISGILVDKAIERGGFDNITVIIGQI